MQFVKIGIASDHAGRGLRRFVLDHLNAPDIKISDFGMAFDCEKPADYPDYGALLAEKLSAGQLDGAIAICGTGLGMAITANKFPGVRAACVWDENSARMCREHNNCNMICLGARTLDPLVAMDLLRIWLNTGFAGGRHQLRLDKIHKIEKQNCRKG